jgi:hypothetical protein
LLLISSCRIFSIKVLNIGLIGHSEGMIAPMVATKAKNVQFIVLMAAPGTAVDELLTRTKLFSRKISWNE